MPKFAANLTMLFTETPFMGRFALAREAGFKYVEYLLPYAFGFDELKGQLDSNGLKQVLFNLPCGDWAAGERGIAANPGRVEEFRAGVAKAIEYAKALGVTQLNCLAGRKSLEFSGEAHWTALVENVRYAAKQLQANGLTLLVEPINHYDLPGFFLNRTDQVVKLLQEVNQPGVFLQYDVYHAQREEGELIATLRQHAGKIGHIQIADNPGRHEPGTGEINYPFVLKEIDTMGYQGFIGLEYIATLGGKPSFDWIKQMGYKL
jgi:hydroxypyruvate isomerase